MRIHRALAGVALVAATLIAACGGAPPLTPDEMVAAFIAKTNDPARTYHSDLQGTYINDQAAMPGQNMTLNMSASFDFHGDDYAGTVTTQLGGGIAGGMANTVSYIKIGEMAWVKYDGAAAWERVGAGAGAPPPGMEALTGLAATDVTYEAAETIDDQQLHRIRVNDPAAAFTRAFGTGAGTGLQMGEGSEYLIYVDGQGVPVAAQSHLVGSTNFGEMPPVGGIPLSEIPQMSFTLNLTHNYSGWGSEIVVLQPPV